MGLGGGAGVGHKGAVGDVGGSAPEDVDPSVRVVGAKAHHLGDLADDLGRRQSPTP